MITIEKVEVTGIRPAMRGMRNAMNSWANADTRWTGRVDTDGNPEIEIGPNDLSLANRLAFGGSTHAKYRRMIIIYVDITAPLYWWKEFDTYKVGTVSNSCSTMHKIDARDLVPDDFSTEHLEYIDSDILEEQIERLNVARRKFKETNDKTWWWHMIQQLPSSYNQKRTIMLNYEVATTIIRDRFNHKLDEWHEFVIWLLTLPYMREFAGIDRVKKGD